MEHNSEAKLDINSSANTENLTGEEKMFAMFSHLSIFFGAVFLPLIFWVINSQKSKFVSFHALQSLVFHIAYVMIMVFVVIIVSLAGIVTGLIEKTGGQPKGQPDTFQIIVILALGVFVFGYIFGSIGYSVYLAINSYKGGMKKYPIIGNIVYKKVYGQ